MRLWVAVLVAPMAACSTSSVPPAGGGDDAQAGMDAPAESTGSAGDAAPDGGSEAGSCVCAPGGACDALGCPPDYNSAAFTSWCGTVQAASVGHQVNAKACGSLLLVTYGDGAGCEKGYVFDQNSGAAIAALRQCGTPAVSCALLGLAACVPACCLDGTCTLGIPSVCPTWQGDAAADAPGDGGTGG